MSQAGLQEQAAVQVQAMGLNMMKEQAAALDKLLSSVQLITDPNLGRNVNLLAWIYRRYSEYLARIKIIIIS